MPPQSLDETLYEKFEALREARELEDRQLIDFVSGLDEAALEQDLAPQEQQGEEAAQVASAACEAAAPAVPKEDAPNDAEQHEQVGGGAPAGSPTS